MTYFFINDRFFNLGSNNTAVQKHNVVLPRLSQHFCQKMGTVFQIKFLKFWRYSKVCKGPKAEGHVLALGNWIICSCVIQMALIWLMAWLQIKAMWITHEWMIQFPGAETCPSAFGPFHTLEYFQNNDNFIWNTVSIFWKNLGWAMATLAQWHQHSHYPTTTMSNCLQGGNRCPKQWDNSNATTRPKGMTTQQRDRTMGGQMGNKEEVKQMKKKAQKMSNDIFWAVCKLSFLSYFIILLLMMFLSINQNYRWWWQQDM